MNGASLYNSVLLHSHSLSLFYSSASSSSVYLISPRFTTSKYISISNRVPQSFRTVIEKRNVGFRSFAVKKRNSELLDEEEEDDDDVWGESDVEGDEEDEGEFLPMDKMKKWLEKRPRGFGLGKKYETSIEDKLLDEIEQSWKAQAANLNKLKNDSLNSQQLKRNDNLIKGTGETQIGFRVRVTNLPKKKNVHRDLKAAFKDVSGVLNITPAVSGNKKTKDPVCKGFALVDFKSDIDAKRFVELFDGQRLAFGKVIKQIKCQVVEFTSNESVSKEVYLDNGFKVQKLPYSGLEADSITGVVVEKSSVYAMEESDVSEEDVDETEVEEDEQIRISSSAESLVEHKELETPLVSFKANKSEEVVAETWLNDEQSEETVADTRLDDDDDDELDNADIEEVAEENLEPLNISMSSSEEKQVSRIRRLEQKLLSKEKVFDRRGTGFDSDKTEVEPVRVESKKKEIKKKKKILVKGQAKKGAKIEIPGSSKRLKVKEKALLTGVLEKYAGKVASK